MRGSRTPERMCVGCRQSAHPLTLVRLARGLDGELVVDPRQKMPGRGVYLHLEADCVAVSIKRNQLQKAFGGSIRHGRVEELMVAMRSATEHRFLERLGLARRAGAVAVGVEFVRRAMREGEAKVVIIAKDASASASKQLTSNADRKGLRTVSHFPGARLAAALGLDFLSALAPTGEPFASELFFLSVALHGRTKASYE